MAKKKKQARRKAAAQLVGRMFKPRKPTPAMLALFPTEVTRMTARQAGLEAAPNTTGMIADLEAISSELADAKSRIDRAVAALKKFL
jgi:hypothetical protein